MTSKSKGKNAMPASVQPSQQQASAIGLLGLLNPTKNKKHTKQALMKLQKQANKKKGHTSVNNPAPVQQPAPTSHKGGPNANQPHKGAGNNNKNSQGGGITINNNFNPPAAVPPQAAAAPPEPGVQFDLPNEIHVEYHTSNNHHYLRMACGLIMAWREWRTLTNVHWWMSWLDYRSWSPGQIIKDWLIRTCVNTVLIYGMSGYLSRVAIRPVETYLARTGNNPTLVKRHQQNRSIVPAITQISEYEYRHRKVSRTWFQVIKDNVINIISGAGRPHNYNVSRSTAVLTTIIDYSQQTLSWLFGNSTTTFNLPPETEKFYEQDFIAKKEIISEELLQSVITTRTTNGHIDEARLFTNIEQHIINRTDTALSSEDMTNTNSIATSTTTVAKYIARNNVSKAISLGFRQGPSPLNTNKATGSSNCPSAGGPPNQNGSNQISSARYRPWSEPDSPSDALHRGRSVFMSLVLLALILILATHWGRLLEKLNGVLLTSLSTLRGLTRSMDAIFTKISESIRTSRLTQDQCVTYFVEEQPPRI